MKPYTYKYIDKLFEVIDSYENGNIQIEELQQECAKTYSLLETNIPKEIRNAILNLEAHVDMARFTYEYHEDRKKYLNVYLSEIRHLVKVLMPNGEIEDPKFG